MAPTFIREVVDQNIVINSSTARSVGNSGQTANFVCIVDSQPLANITWSYESFADSRISIMTDRPIQERQVSVLTLFAVQFGDQGQFICNAISPYGSISSTADLNIFGKYEIMSYSITPYINNSFIITPLCSHT